jgi:hypothetical protein
MIVLPTISPQIVRPSLPQWAPIAAVLVLAAGLTPFTWQYANNIQQNRRQVAKNNTQPLKSIPIQPSLSSEILRPQDATQTPSLNLTPPQPQLTPPLANLSTPSAPLPFPNATIPATPTTSPQPPLTIPSVTSSYPINPQVPLPGIIPNPDKATVAKAIPNSPFIPAKKGINVTKPKNPASANAKIPSNLAQASPPVATVPNSSSSNILNIPSSPAAVDLPQDTVGIVTPGQTASGENEDNLVRRLRSATKTNSSTQVTNDKTLFDTPQIAEAREYLNKRWQPPTGLSQALEYSLTLGIDGKIERILPLNRAAREYIDSSGIPEIGKPFVSTNKSGQNLRIRVILSPDRKVQTFPETP